MHFLCSVQEIAIMYSVTMYGQNDPIQVTQDEGWMAVQLQHKSLHSLLMYSPHSYTLFSHSVNEA